MTNRRQGTLNTVVGEGYKRGPVVTMCARVSHNQTARGNGMNDDDDTATSIGPDIGLDIRERFQGLHRM